MLSKSVSCLKFLTTIIFYCYYGFLICMIQQVIPKAEILRLGVLEQSKEEVIIQVSNENWSFKILLNKKKS